MCPRMTHSKHFISTVVRATGRKSLKDLMADCLGIVMIGMLRDLEMLNRFVTTAVSFPAQNFRTHPGTPSGPGALMGLMC